MATQGVSRERRVQHTLKSLLEEDLAYHATSIGFCSGPEPDSGVGPTVGFCSGPEPGDTRS